MFIPPSLPTSLRGEPIEEVRLLRDEVANLAWAVERLVEDAGGRPVDRFEQYQRTRAGTRRDGRRQPAVPATGWRPVSPTTGCRWCRCGWTPHSRMFAWFAGECCSRARSSAVTPAPLGRLLEPGRPLALFEEEVPRAGARVVRRYEYARWADGSGHLWIARRKSAGRGEGASGLRFDILVQQ